MKYNVTITYNHTIVAKDEIEAIQKMKEYIEKKQIQALDTFASKENDNGKV